MPITSINVSTIACLGDSMIRVRFHLAAGINHMKWQIVEQGRKMYVCPNEYQLIMRGCRLRNRRATAEYIHNGAHKTVCAWVECLKIEVVNCAEVAGEAILYNPRVAPHWVEGGEDADGRTYPLLLTSGRTIFKTDCLKASSS
jgi:hypothetical protein